MAKLQRIMHIEDEVDLRDVVALALCSFGGYTVESCASGLEALSKVNAFAPELILLDVMMPVMDGPTTLKKLRENPITSQIPIVFMTAKFQPDEHHGFLSLGAAGIIAKPFRIETLCSQIEDIWSRFS